MADNWFAAARRDDIEFIQNHLSAFAGTKDAAGRTALMHAAETGALKAIELLVSKEKLLIDNTHNCALSLAILAGVLDAARVLAYHESAFRYQCGRDCLMLAAEVASFEMVALLAQYVGKNVDVYGQTALTFAVRRGQPEMVKYLFQCFYFTESELLGALHNFSGPNFIEVSSLIYLQYQRLKSELCRNCQSTTMQMVSSQQEIRCLKNLLQMEQTQSNALHTQVQKLASKLECSKDDVFRKIERLLELVLKSQSDLPANASHLFSRLEPNNLLIVDPKQLDNHVLMLAKEQKHEIFILKQQIEALIAGKGMLRNKLLIAEKALETANSSLEATNTQLQKAIAEQDELRALLLSKNNKIEEYSAIISTLEKENNRLSRQIDVLLHEDAKITKNGITPLIKSIMLDELETATDLVDKYAGMKTSEGLSAMHILLQLKRLNFEPISIRGYNRQTSKRKPEKNLYSINFYSPMQDSGKTNNNASSFSIAFENTVICSNDTHTVDMSEEFEPFYTGQTDLRFIESQIQIEIPTPYLDSITPIKAEPLLCAEDRQAVLLLQKLAEKEANIRTMNNETGLELALNDENLLAIDILAPFQARLNTSRGNPPIFEAIKAIAESSKNDAEKRIKRSTICKTLLEHSAGLCDDEGATPLMIAAQYNAYEVVRLLVGTETRKQNAYGDTALMIAVICGHTSIVQTLAPLESGLFNHDGFSALMLAITLQRDAELRILLPYELLLFKEKDNSPLIAVLNTQNARLSFLLIEELIKQVEARQLLDAGNPSMAMIYEIQKDVLSFNFDFAIARAIRWTHHWEALCTNVCN